MVASFEQEEEVFEEQAVQVGRPPVHSLQGPGDGRRLRLDQVRPVQVQLPLLKSQAEQEPGLRCKLPLFSKFDNFKKAIFSLEGKSLHLLGFEPWTTFISVFLHGNHNIASKG